jgi:cytochrome c oxidase cbb3-type subunit III
MSNSIQDNHDRDQQDMVTGHVYDGIEEFDNKLPNWWLTLLWGSIVFALGYWLVFQTLQLRDTPYVRFETEMLQAQEAELARMAEAGLSDESLLMMSEMSNKVADGREIWVKHCVACHKDQGQGDIGPNLTDAYWINGCTPLSMHDTVVNGVTTKGMPAWLNQLGPTRVQAVVSYVLTLRNTNIPDKAPEGEPCEF